jgi:hypothetical protein
MKSIDDLVAKIRMGVLDINVHELFFVALIKGLIYNLNNDIKIRGNYVPHMITHTGDDRMWLEAKGYNAAIEPGEISNENTIYNTVPRCNINLSNIDIDAAQLTNPYSIGSFQYEADNDVYMLSGEFRRMPVKLTVELKYTIESYTDMLELIQYIMSNMSFIRTYDIIYLGHKIKCSYKIPDSFSDEHSMDIDGAMTDERDHKLSLSLEVESNVPIFNNKTIISSDKIINVCENIIVAK